MFGFLGLVALFFPLMAAETNPMPVSFDERVDLMSVVWRLAGDRNFCCNNVPAYCRDVDAYFAPYKEHTVVAKAIECMESSGIGYDAVVSYGMHLVISADGKISYDQQFAEHGDASFDRWSEQQKAEFLPLLEDFYRESKFHQWFVSTEAVRNEVIAAFAEVGRQLDMQWFDSFFGLKSDNSRFQIVLSILCGVHNYGCSAKMMDGSELLSPVISGCVADAGGGLQFNPQMVLPIVVHEFCHSYCNLLNAKYWKKMRKNATALFDLEKDKLISQAYGRPEIMLDETFVRSCVIRYQLSHGMEAEKGRLVGEQMQEGFQLTADVVEKLGMYERQRDKYTVLEDFMPVYIRAVNAYPCRKLAEAKAKAALHNATFTCNIADGDTNIPSGLFNLTITFSKPMRPNISIGFGRRNGAFIPLAYELKESFSWNEDHTVQIIYLDLDPDTQYSFSILGDHYMTEDGYTAGKTVDIDFTTGK